MAEYTGIGWGLSEDSDDLGRGQKYVMLDGTWHECPEDLWDVIVDGLAERGEELEDEG